MKQKIEEYCRVWFIIIIVSIVIAAHPIGPFRFLGHQLSVALSAMSINVSMTPFTNDMALMVERDSGGNFYARKLTIFYTQQGRELEALWSDLHFYRFRLPLLLFFDWNSNGTLSMGHVRALCRFLKLKYGDVEKFRATMSPSSNSDLKLGLNRDWHCNEK